MSSADGKEYSTRIIAISRVHEGVRLYFKCKDQSVPSSCRILLSGGDPQGVGISEAQVMGRELMELGVKKEDILLEEKSRNTYENAKFSKVLLREQIKKTKLTILVTSGGHLRRATAYFSHFGIQTLGAPSDSMSAYYSLFPRAQNLFLSDLALHEILGLWRFQIYEALGWNE